VPAEDQNREEANLQSTNGNHSFDELAKGLATGSFSRGQALRWMGAALLGGVLASVPGLAFAHHKPDHTGGPPEGEQGCPAGKVRVSGQCVCPEAVSPCGNTCCALNERCITPLFSNGQQVCCPTTCEAGITAGGGEARCIEFGFSCNFQDPCNADSDCFSGQLCIQTPGCSGGGNRCANPC
jgi:hypothetical protein